MKFTKLSLAALIAMGVASSAFAVENVKVDGQIKLWYQTTDMGTVRTDTAASTANQDGLLEQVGASGDLVAKLRATGDLTKKVGFGVVLYSATTLGLENNLVSGEAIGVGSSNGTATSSVGSTTINGITNGDSNWPVWLGEAYFTYKAGNTIAKIGRQELDTPLAFTETWNAAPNTFEAAVLINKDLPNTTLVGAYVSRGNGAHGSTVTSRFNQYGNAASSYAVGETGAGAYAFGLVNTSIPGLTIHPVYYDVIDVAQAYWVDLAYTGLPYGIKIEGLYSSAELSGDAKTAFATTSDKKTDAYAVKLSGELSGVKLGASYSNVSAGVLPIANTATGFTKTKIYTASILSDGRIAAQPDVSAWKLEASTKLAGFDLGASYGTYDIKSNNNQGRAYTSYTLNQDKSPSEFDFSVGTKIDDVNLAAYYIIQSDYTATAATGSADSRDRQAIRVIASINF